MALANRSTGARAHESGFLGAGRAQKKANAAPAAEPLELTLLLFSPRTHEFVAEVNMRYAGPSLAQALSRFSDRVHSELPGLTCMGWKWDEPR
jgi:hypothetical protein